MLNHFIQEVHPICRGKFTSCHFKHKRHSMIKFPLHIIHCGFSFSLYFNILCQMSVTYTRNLNCTGKIMILIWTNKIKKKKKKMAVLHLTTTIRNGTNHSWNIFIYSIFVLLHKAGPHNRFYFRIDTWYQHIYRFLEYNSLNATSPKNDKCTSYDNCTICMTTHINSNI